ncbi:MAG: hypothetical protein ACE5FR_07390 [Rhodospirillales bacterium]
MNPDDVRAEDPEGNETAHTGPGDGPGGEGPERGAGPFRGEGDPAGDGQAPAAAPDAGAIPDTATTEAIFADLAKADPDITAALRRQWGADAAKNLAFARAAVDTVVSQELVDFLEGVELDGQPLSHHPAIWETAARIGRMLARDPGRPGSVGPAPLQPRGTGTNMEQDRIEDRIDELMALMHTDKKKYQSERVQRELRALYGSQPRAPGAEVEKKGSVEERIDTLMALMHTDERKYQSEPVQRELRALYGRLYGDRSIVGRDGQVV